MASDNGVKTGVFAPGLTENALFEIRSVNCTFLVGVVESKSRFVTEEKLRSRYIIYYFADVWAK